MRKIDPIGWLAIVIVGGVMLYMGISMRDAIGAPEPTVDLDEMVPVRRGDVLRMFAERLALGALIDQRDGEIEVLQNQIITLRNSLACT